MTGHTVRHRETGTTFTLDPAERVDMLTVLAMACPEHLAAINERWGHPFTNADVVARRGELGGVPCPHCAGVAR